MFSIALRSAPESEPVSVTVERIAERGQEIHEVRIGERTHDVTVEWHSPNRGCLRLHGTLIPFAAGADAESVHVWLRGRTYVLQKVDRRSRRAAGPTAIASDEILAPMPGTILKIHVGAGASFAANEPILVMESMKMEMSLSSPAPGSIKEFRCRVGELVELGAVLAKLELRE